MVPLSAMGLSQNIDKEDAMKIKIKDLKKVIKEAAGPLSMKDFVDQDLYKDGVGEEKPDFSADGYEFRVAGDTVEVKFAGEDMQWTSLVDFYMNGDLGHGKDAIQNLESVILELLVSANSYHEV